ncbi:MAG: hypothetical protein WAP98_07530 [Caldicoprobacterales bacterium]|nr:hypothetical protein [Clostridia bacterium]MDI9512962.1 hypothetical protein [Bacillota bacterium]NLH58363.1 hypothetical protein [Clostridiales bacterium]
MLVAEKYAYLEEMEYDFPIQKPRVEQPAPRKKQKEQPAPVAKPNTLRKLLALATVLICFAMACLVVYRYAGINDNHTKILELEKELQKTLDEQERLKVELAYNQDMRNVEFQAMGSLNMHYPEKDQVRYVRLPEAEETIKTELVKEQEPKESFWMRILGFLN